MKAYSLCMIVAAFLLSAGAFFSCNTPADDELLPVPSSADTTDYRDLIAFFDPFAAVVYILPDHEPAVLEALSMTPLDPTEPWYLLPARTVAGDPITLEVTIALQTHAQLLITKASVEARLDELVTSDELARETIASSSTLANHYCKEVDIARTSRCHVIGSRSTNSRTKDRFLCVKGSGKCTQWRDVVAYRYLYNNRSCSGSPAKTETFTGDTCD